MKKTSLILASSIESADILYASGFNAHDPFIYLAQGKDKYLIVSALELARAKHECKKGLKVLCRDEFGPVIKTGDLLCAIAEKFAAATISVPASFPVFYADALRNKGVEIVPAEGDFMSERQIKKASEIREIERALRIAEKALLHARDIIAEAKIGKDKVLIWNGEILTSEILRAEIDLVLFKGNCEANGTIASSGVDAAQPHNSGSGPIKAEKTIVLDIFPRLKSTGYWGDLTRTFVKGKAPGTVKLAFEAVREARDTAKQYIKDAVPSNKPYNAAMKVLNKYKFPTGVKDGIHYGFFHSLGHALGLEIHEAPRMSPMNKSPLRKGNVITVEPGLYYHEWGGIRLEDIVVVGENSCECLTRIDSVLEIP